MIWNDHSNLTGKHAVLGPSKGYWSEYEDEQLLHFFDVAEAAQKGTEDHAFACLCIKRRQRLPKSKNTLTLYVNDAIGFRLDPEICLYYSDNCFGWSDAIGYDSKENVLRVFDLKTGQNPADMRQLKIYAALYCLEYKKKPEELGMELRIYQGGEFRSEYPDPKDIRRLMNVIIHADRIAEKRKAKG